MADLTTNFAGIRCPNPFWLASGPPTNCGEQVMRAFDAGWGGAVANPGFVLAQMISQMKDRGGHIKIPGFYDDVVPLQDEERKAWAQLPFNEKTYKSDWRVPTTYLAKARELMATIAPELVEPPFAPPTKRFPFKGKPITAPANQPDVKLEQDGTDMPEFHPILTTGSTRASAVPSRRGR